MTIHLALIDHTSVRHGIDLDRLAHALNRQLGHVAKTGWPIYFDVHHYKTHVDRNGVEHPANPNAWPLYLVDDTDQANALGYHDVTDDGRPVGKAFIGDALRLGLEPTVTISHEVLEIAGDPYCTACFDIGVDNHNRQWMAAAELCDPVEADADGYDIDGILVSDFVTPAWFDPNDLAGPYDWNRYLTRPLELRPGGYASVWVEGDGWTQVVSDRRAEGGALTRALLSHRIEQRMERQRELSPLAAQPIQGRLNPAT